MPKVARAVFLSRQPHAAFDEAGAGDVAWSRCCDTRKRKGELTGNTKVDLHQRASPRPDYGEKEIEQLYNSFWNSLQAWSMHFGLEFRGEEVTLALL